MRLQDTLFATVLLASIPAAAEELCSQGQCATGSYCDFSALPSPVCRLIPAAPAATVVPPPATQPPPQPTTFVQPALVPAYPPLPESAPQQASPPVGTPSAVPPVAPPQPVAAPTDGWVRMGFADSNTTQSAMIHRIGIGYYGRRDVPLFDLASSASVPVSIGLAAARYWYSDTFAVDVGLGVQWLSSSTEFESGNDTSTTRQPAVVGALLHVGVPIVLSSYRDLSVLLVPEIELGVTNRTTEAEGDADNLEESGLSANLGLRAGAELRLGMIGLPQLALESTFGAAASVEIAKATQGNDAASLTSTRLLVPAVGSPLDIFTANLSLRYYL